MFALRRLALFTSLAFLALASVATASDLGPITEDLRSAFRDWAQLRDRNLVEFRTQQAEMRYQRAMRRLRNAIRDLEDHQGGGGGHQNFRGQAVLAIREHVHAGYASDVIAKLPQWVTADDFTFVQRAAPEVHAGYVVDAFGAYFQNPSDRDRTNRRGLAAAALAEHVHVGYLTDALGTVGSYLTQDDAEFYAFAGQEMHVGYLVDALRAFQTHPSSRWEGNRKGSAARVIVEEAHVAYAKDALAVLPSFVSEQDLAAVRQIADDSHSAYLAERLREYFGTSR